MTLYSKLAFRKRTGDTDFAIEEDHLGEIAANERLRITRAQEKELPREVSVLYMDYDADYLQSAQYSRRLTGAAEGKDRMEIALVTDADHAKQISEVALYTAWLTRQRYEFVTDQRWAHVEPTDAGTVTCDGVTHTVRIQKKVEQTDGTIKWEAFAENVQMYLRPTGSEPGVAPPASGQVIGIVRDCTPVMLDIPWFGLPNVTMSSAYYMFARPMNLTDQFFGASFYESSDNGTTWTQVGYQTKAATFGYALNDFAAPAYGEGKGDEASELTLYVESGTLTSTDADGLYAHTNLALLGDEIIAFRDAQELTGGQYRLTGFHRGLYGTEWAMSQHAAYEQFVLLDDAIVGHKDASSNIGTTRKMAAVGRGGYVRNAAMVDYTRTGTREQPLSAVLPAMGVNAAGDLSIRFVSRTRLPVTLVNASAPRMSSDDSVHFDVEIYDTSFSTLKRTMMVYGEPTNGVCRGTYTAAQQTTDFGSTQTSIGVRIYQLGQQGSPGERGPVCEAILSA